MGLRKLLSDLTGGMADYPSHNTNMPNSHNAHTPSFNVKEVKRGLHFDNNRKAPFIKPVTWDITDIDANPTYNDGITKNNQWDINNLDGSLRGGALLSGNRRLIDSKRIGNLLLSNRGIEFIARQTGLQLMNPRINRPHGGHELDPGTESNSPNQLHYILGVNTLAQVALGGMAPFHLKREGTDFIDNGYHQYAKKTAIKNSPYSNRLIHLHNTKISATMDPAYVRGNRENPHYLADAWEALFDREPQGTEGNLDKFGMSTDGFGSGFLNLLNKIGGKGEALYEYINGPGSIFGIGRTTIGRYTDTTTVGGKLIDYQYAKEYGSISNTSNGNINVEGGVLNFQSINRQAKIEIEGTVPHQKLFPTWKTYSKESKHAKYKTGDPGAINSEQIKETTEKDHGEEGLLDYSVYIKSKVDLVNAIDVFRVENNEFPHLQDDRLIDDMVPFYFESINYTNPLSSDVIYFRALIDDISDNFKASHNKFSYNGRAEEFYTYKGFDRDISFSFKIAAQTRHEMMPLYRKLNFLASHTAPEYNKTSGRMMTPFMKLTIGDWISGVPGLLSSIGLKWSKDYPWEIRAHNKLDKDMLILPHILDVSVKFQPVHSFVPQKGIDTPFILPNNDSTDSKFYTHLQKWLALGIEKEEIVKTENKTTNNRVSNALRPGYEKLEEIEKQRVEMESMQEE